MIPESSRQVNGGKHYQHVVQLTLVNISKDVTSDLQGTKIKNLVQNDILSSPIPAIKYLHDEKVSDDEIQSIQDRVLRFLQVKDKYMALVSILLKSQCFHQQRQRQELQEQQQLQRQELQQQQEKVAKTTNTKKRRKMKRSVVDLPRTEYQKPYIPVPSYEYQSRSQKNKMILCNEKEEDIFPFSVSHQFPFVGIAALQVEESTEEMWDERPYVGMDIVTFESYNPRVYTDEREFIDSFRGSFTDYEWSYIGIPSEYQVQEFLVRWSMKEAYTKALGVGMGLAFDSFDIHLPINDNMIWDSVLSAENYPIYFSGTVKSMKDDDNEVDKTKKRKPRSEFWDFSFLPLFDCDSVVTNISSVGSNKNLGMKNMEQPKGCACICIGPLPSPLNPTSRFRIELPVESSSSSNLQSLIQWHRPI